MSRWSRILVLIPGLLCATIPIASRTPAEPAAKADDGKTLFDGKTLQGWESSDFAHAGKVQVKDGVIVLEKGGPMTGVTWTGGDFPTMDYEVTLEAKKTAGNDFFATTTFPVGKSFCSLVVGGWGGKVVGLSSLNSLDASENDTRKDREFKTDQWYRIRIRVSGKRIEAWIDRDKLVDADTEDRKVGIRIECTACKPFGVACYNTSAAVRDLRVRSLTEAEKKAIAEAAEKKE
jgi:hypothetical protein